MSVKDLGFKLYWSYVIEKVVRIYNRMIIFLLKF